MTFLSLGGDLQTLCVLMYECFTSFNSDHLAASLISSLILILFQHLITYLMPI